MDKTEVNLKDRVMECRTILAEIGVKSARHYFSLKYPEFKDDVSRLDNLWYCKVLDEEFATKLEEFTNHKRQEFN